MKKENKYKIEIAMAIYNGSVYIGEFLESLLSQTYRDWTVLARDDISADGSVSIFESWMAAHKQACLIKDTHGNLGVVRNFSEILSSTKAKYVMLADQDDVWYPEKIAKSIAAIQKLESSDKGDVQPALVFSDLHVVDSNLDILHSSFVHMQGLAQLQQPTFHQLLTQNVAPGCTMIVNRALLELALPIPLEVAMHDWWLMQIAVLFGRIGYIDEPTIAYRQHTGNQVGATSRGLIAITQEILKGGGQYRKRLHQAQLQAGAVVARYGKQMRKSDLDAASIFSNLSKYPPLIRQIMARKHGLRKAGFMRNVGFYCLM